MNRAILCQTHFSIPRISPPTLCNRKLDSAGQPFGKNTYHGSKLIFKSDRGDVFVATMPTRSFEKSLNFEHLLNAAEVIRVTSKLRCSMYDNALLPVVLANQLVSLADIPSSEILKRFATQVVCKA
jgi:hypothetical protein